MAAQRALLDRIAPVGRSLGIGVVMREGENGLALGERLADVKAGIETALPLGIHFEQHTNQAEAVSRAVSLFQIKFMVAVAVVMLVSFVSLGLRPGLIVGVAVPLTLGITFLLMLVGGAIGEIPCVGWSLQPHSDCWESAL